ncbi:MAG: ParB/RepB/Spo0J family partition protein [Chlamydiales bacterium]
MPEVSETHSFELKFAYVKLNSIRVNPYQPRRVFEQEALEELASSIKEIGLIQPLVVRSIGSDLYELIAGERRFRACQIVQLETVPILIKHTDTSKAAEASLVENIQRVDLNAIEIGRALRRLMVDFSLTQEEIASRVGMKRSSVANYLRLLSLPIEAQEALIKGSITMGHAKVLLSIEHGHLQHTLLNECIHKQWSVRQIEKEAKKCQHKGAMTRTTKTPDIHIERFSETLQNKLGTKVTMKGSPEKGRITIEYFSLEDLDRLSEIFGINSSL